MTCKCGANVEFTVAKDMSSKVILIECMCPDCGFSSHGYGMTVEQALASAKKDWAKKRRKRSA